MKEYRLSTLEDLLQLDERQIDDCLKDLKTWYELRKKLGENELLLKAIGSDFLWIDDGINGVSDVSVVGAGMEVSVSNEGVLNSKDAASKIVGVADLIEVIAKEIGQDND